MKTLISAVLALTLLGTAGASAQDWRGGNNYGGGYGGNYGGHDRGYHDSYRQDYRQGYHRGYRGHDNSGAVIGLGVGLFALAAILSSQQQRDDRYQPGYDGYYGNGYYGR